MWRSMRSTVLLVLVIPLLASISCQAQIARVTASQRVTEKKSGEAAWLDAPLGASLRVEDRFRTGKRSKADLKFRDGSLVRLGQLSYLELRGPKQMSLLRGQLLFVALKPGRILAGAAAAEIKGSVAIVQYRNHKNGDENPNIAEFFLYSGAMDVVTPQQTISLQPGQKATVYSDGRIVVGAAPPLQYFDGELHPDILLRPGSNPFAGSLQHRDWRDDPERIERDHNFAAYFAPDGLNNAEDVVFPETSNINTEGFINGGLLAAPLDGDLNANFARAGEADSGSNLQPSSPLLFSKTVRFAQADTGEMRDAQTTLQVAEDAVEEGEISLDARAAYEHLAETQFDNGRMFGGDAALVGAAANRGAAAYGARLNGFASSGKWFAQAAYFPLRVRARFDDNDEKETRDFSAISDASLTYTDSWGEVQIGRQRFLSGPTQATLFGSLVRAGGREVMDAVRVAPDIGDDYKLELAYLHDAFPNKLPYRIGGRQNGFYGRLATQRSYGNFGLNVLKYSDANADDTTGATIDFAFPLVRDKVEFYGEVGRDPFRRRLTSLGFTFPALYEKTGWDVFAEYARLSRDNENRPPTEYAIRAYKRINKHVNFVAAVSRFSGDETKFAVGVSIGARTSR